MAWTVILNNTLWEYDNAPPDPANGQTPLWSKQVNGIRTNADGSEIYTKCRKIGSGVESSGELSKTYYDNII